MNEPDEFSPQQLEAAAAAERVFGSPRAPDAEEIRISFDWEIPRQAGDPLTFLLDIKRGNRQSSVRFTIDLAKLAGADLQRLHPTGAKRIDALKCGSYCSADSPKMNNQAPGSTLPHWVKLTGNSVAQPGASITEEELFKHSALSPENQALVDKSFGTLEDAFLQLEYATWWGWPTLDIPTTTAEEAIVRGWCGANYKSPQRLLTALAKEGYQHKTLTYATCVRLEAIKEERQRQQAQQRQRKRRARLSPAARAEIREKNRQYQEQKRENAKKEATGAKSSA